MKSLIPAFATACLVASLAGAAYAAPAPHQPSKAPAAAGPPHPHGASLTHKQAAKPAQKPGQKPTLKSALKAAVKPAARPAALKRGTGIKLPGKVITKYVGPLKKLPRRKPAKPH